ncbi:MULTISPECIES: DHHW family protein [Faecalicoccus]|uniref:DHHW family protein n=1 Tax=Faecalicoccus pleomorphus TaxID=1323 RepID=A0AAW6CMS9_9FIRM|nr:MULTISPECIES: DHHW family protein [Faecalicoccus]MDB7979190.1 DHHW family protein [Faecalicoccus pleomorphus]MDB7981678.1 DHHW family protein [Faecalicoccus pleomorphus]
MKDKMTKLSKKMSPILAVCVVIVCVLNLLWPDAKTSSMENRSLQQFPTISLSSINDGQFFKDVNNWYSDQFVGRDQWIQLKYLISKMTGVKKVDDVYLGKGALIEDTSAVNEEQKERNIQAINQFCTKSGKASYFLLAPNAVSVQSDKLPSFATPLDQNAQIDDYLSKLDASIQKVDVRDSFKEHKNEYLYYKTDHHWTSLGSYYAYQALSSSMDLGQTEISDYHVYPVSTDFKGTLSGKVGSAFMEDQIDIYVPKENSEYIMTDETSRDSSRSIYSMDALHTKDQYTVFLSGNTGRISLEMDNDSDRHLLLIKDSYANSMIQFLIPHFRTIDIIDPRYYFEDVSKLLDSQLITDILFLYNSNTLMQDTSIADCLNVSAEE